MADNFDQYRVDNPNAKERVRQSFYHFQAYAAAGQAQLQFFGSKVGQSGLTYADTNMEAVGQLPAGYKFRLESIEIHLFPGVDPSTYSAAPAAGTIPKFTSDMYAVGKSGWLELKIGAKPYLQEGPLMRFPTKTRIDRNASASAVTTTAATTHAIMLDYASWGGRPYYLKPFITIMPQQNFSVNLNWPAVVALPSGQAARIGVILDGVLQRYSQ